MENDANIFVGRMTLEEILNSKINFAKPDTNLIANIDQMDSPSKY